MGLRNIQNSHTLTSLRSQAVQYVQNSFRQPFGLGGRFRVGVTWNVIAAVLTQGSNFLSNVVIANLLGQDAFGSFGVIQSTILTSAGIAQIATGITATKYVAEFRSRAPERAGGLLGLCSAVTLVTGIIATLVIWFSAPWLTVHALKDSSLTGGLRIAAWVVLFAVMNGYQMGALAGLESYRTLALGASAQGFFQIVVSGLGAWRWGVKGALFGLLATAAARWIFFHFALRHESAEQDITIRYSGLAKEFPILLRFAIPAALSGMSSAPAVWIGIALLMRQPGGHGQVALFSAALSFKSVALFLPLVLNNVGMSILNNQRGLRDQNRFRKVFWANTGITLGCVLLGALFIAVTGRFLLKAFGHGFTEAYPVLLLLMVAAVIETLAIAIYQIIQAQERMWLSLFGVVLPKDFGLVMSAYLLVPSYHAVGLGTAHIVCATLNCVAVLIIARFTGFKLPGSNSSITKPLVLTSSVPRRWS